jgi:hypothetical protein
MTPASHMNIKYHVLTINEESAHIPNNKRSKGKGTKHNKIHYITMSIM